MKELIIPRRIQTGDTVAIISLSVSRAGDPNMRPRYDTGKSRFEEYYQVNVIETTNALAGIILMEASVKFKLLDFCLDFSLIALYYLRYLRKPIVCGSV